MVPDRLQYFLEHFGMDQSVHRIWTRWSGIYYQNISNNIRTFGNVLDKSQIFISENLKNWKSSKMPESPRHHGFVFFVFRNFFLIEYLILYYIFWRWGPANDKDWLNKVYKSLIMKFISIKNMKWQFGNM